MSEVDFSKELAIVTGATGGIGKATCRALALLKCSIAVHYHSAREGAEALVEELTKQNVNAQAFQADLSNYDEVQRSRIQEKLWLTAHKTRKLYSEVTSSMGHPSILFNNAGVTIKHGVMDISEISVEQFEQTWRSNCGSAFLLTQLCLPAMEAKKWGRVIFCSSVAGFTGGVVGPHYAYVDQTWW